MLLGAAKRFLARRAAVAAEGSKGRCKLGKSDRRAVVIVTAWARGDMHRPAHPLEKVEAA